jgi:hypothetical protein
MMKALKWPLIKLVCVAILLMNVSRPVQAQLPTRADSSSDLKVFLTKIKQAYGKATYLQFRLTYRYANERQPGQYLDSLLGEVEMDKGRSRTVLDGMETVLNDRYIIQIIPDNKVIYLAAAHTAPASSAVTQNPVAMMDSLFAHKEGMKTSVEHEEGTDILNLDMPAGQAYSKLRMTIDNRTGYFREVEYSLNTASLVGEEMIDRPGHPGPYQSRGRIQIVFTDYRNGQFDDRIFSEDNFFTRVSGRYEPAARFKNYHLYLASSNL